MRCVGVNVCVEFCLFVSFRGGKKAPIEPRVQSLQQVAVPFDAEMSFPSVSDFEETEDIIDEGDDFSLDTLAVLTLMETVRWVVEFTHGIDCGRVLYFFGAMGTTITILFVCEVDLITTSTVV